MNNQHAKGEWNEIKGKAKEKIGHVTGNTHTELTGIADQLKAKVQKSLGDVKDAVKRGVDSVLEHKPAK